MCRMLSFVSMRKGILDVLELIEALVKASERDPYLEAIASTSSHSDGWGCAIVYSKDGYENVLYYKTLRPIFEDTIGVKRVVNAIRESEYAMGIIHSRKASRGEPISVIDTHPFHEVSVEGSEFYLVHNGTIRKELLAKRESLPLNRSDTLVLTMYLSRYPVSEHFKVLREIACKELVKSALNLGVLVLNVKGGRYVLTSSYHVFEKEDPDREAYYKQYLVGGGEYYGVVSSTVIDYYLSSVSHEKIEQGSIGVLKVCEDRVTIDWIENLDQ